jgi:hypothetical protein
MLVMGWMGLSACVDHSAFSFSLSLEDLRACDAICQNTSRRNLINANVHLQKNKNLQRSTMHFRIRTDKSLHRTMQSLPTCRQAIICRTDDMMVTYRDLACHTPNETPSKQPQHPDRSQDGHPWEFHALGISCLTATRHDIGAVGRAISKAAQGPGNA